MSGGSWDYAFGRIGDIVSALQNDTTSERRYKLDLNPHQIELRHRLAELLEKVATAMHAIEWVDSGDTPYPSDCKAIEKVFETLEGKPSLEMRYDREGALDEIVAKNATVHMENMGSTWSIIIDAGSARLNLSLGGRLKKPLVVDQEGTIVVTHPTR
jgi:hypothetical protein